MLGMGWRRAIVLLVLALAAVGAPPHPLRAQGRIMIESNSLEPPVLTATIGEEVTFVNRSGRAAHVEFLGDSVRHHVVQVPNTVSAVFHTPGRHPYVVHFPGSGVADLHGVVEVPGDPRERLGGQTCNGITVMGACLER